MGANSSHRYGGSTRMAFWKLYFSGTRMNSIVGWLIRALIIFVAANIVPGFHLDGYTTALVLVVILGILNVIVKPILLLFTLPINLLTLGLFSFVINAVILILASKIVSGVQIESFLTAIIAAVMIGFLSSVVDTIL